MTVPFDTIRLAWSVPPLAKSTALLALVLAVAAATILLVRKWAGRTGQDVADASDLLSKFREVHAGGGLSDSEYRTIKTKLAPELEAVTSADGSGSGDTKTPRSDRPTDPPIDPNPA
ncbi:MAG: hypothetical protein AAFV43_11695 [Planctomycetota bacterium]